ncbi:MAG TPA: hypothetical protein DC047_18645, partial [Blastocatellia bacterium]|nr:hypothetical protein [Blastocatellia bacterium]
MPRHVILLTDAHEAPAYELIEALRVAGVQTLIEGLREVEAEAALIRRRESESVSEHSQESPLAVLYEVFAGADTVELHAAIDHAKTFWPGTPVIACRRHSIGFHGFNARGLDGATLKRLGFRAIADKAAQLPAILREIEGHGATGDLRLPETIRPVTDPSLASLPAKMKAASLRAAFNLVSSLHFIGDQNDAAQVALTGLTALATADRWTIYLLADEKGPEAATLEAIASLVPANKVVPELRDEWRQVLLAGEAVSTAHESKAAKLAGAGMGTIRKKEQGEFVVAIPLICGERILGVLEGRRELGSFKKSELALLDALALPIASALANAVRIG